MKQKFDITGMSCAACSAHVEKAVRKLEGIRSADVSLMTNSMMADFDESVLSADDIIQAVKASGYGASLPARAGAKAEERRPNDILQEELAGMKRRFVWSSCCPCSTCPWGICWACRSPPSCPGMRTWGPTP